MAKSVKDSPFHFDMERVQNETEKMQTSSNNDFLFFKQQDIEKNGEIYLRVLPPLPSLNGLMYLPIRQFWMDSKPYISPSSFGLPCPIVEFLDSFKNMDKDNSDYDDINSLLNSQQFSDVNLHVFPALILDIKYSGSEIKKIKVVEKKPAIFQCSVQVQRQINKIATHRENQNGTPLGFMDMRKGYNLIIEKQVNNKKTEYKVNTQRQSTDLKEHKLTKYYKPENIPDVYEVYNKFVYSYDYLQGCVNSFFLGEDMPDEELKYESFDSSSSKKDKKKKKKNKKEEKLVEVKKDKKKKKKKNK